MSTQQRIRALVVALVAGLVLAIGTRNDFVPVLTLALLPTSLVVAGFAVAAALLSDPQCKVLRTGQWALGLLAILTLAGLGSSHDDWVHLLWNSTVPLYGFLLGAGLLLVQVWPDDRRQHPNLLRGWNGAVVAGLGVLVLASIPVVRGSLPLERPMIGRVDGAPIPALVEAARYGFDGTIPALMEPTGASQRARGLGSPPRWVTVPLGSTLFAARMWILFVVLACLGRLLPSSPLRHGLYLMIPVCIAPARALMSRGWETALWENDPGLVRTYGPTLLVAAAATVVLFVAVRFDERRSQRSA